MQYAGGAGKYRVTERLVVESKERNYFVYLRVADRTISNFQNKMIECGLDSSGTRQGRVVGLVNIVWNLRVT
jgi:hypothetical protein